MRELYGTWKLLGFTRTEVATGQRTEVFGRRPSGYLTYTPDGRMIAILTKEGRPKFADMSKVSDKDRVELFNSVIAYAGRFTVDGNKVIHHVEVSWNENWTGSKQIRNVRLEGSKLYIRSDPQASAHDGKKVVAELEWERVQ